MPDLDPRQRPPDNVRNMYKRYQKIKLNELNQDGDVLDLLDLSRESDAPPPSKVRIVETLRVEALLAISRTFAADDLERAFHYPDSIPSLHVYEHEDMPGLHIIPSLLPPEVQLILLSRLLHRDLSNPTHLTNIHTHYNVAYPPSNTSFFSLPPESTYPVATPIDPSVHKPLTVAQFLTKKMRWITLGGQYDWTAKQYPPTAAPAFPPDIKSLLESIFPNTKAEAAIVNLYSPGDTLSPHRDVAETSSHGLISVSLGCDAIFVIGTNEKALTLRLRSGGAVYMSGAARFAWHGVPQIMAGTCPDYLQDWPGGERDGTGTFREWKGWMSGKRVNLNVRQMWD